MGKCSMFTKNLGPNYRNLVKSAELKIIYIYFFFYIIIIPTEKHINVVYSQFSKIERTCNSTVILAHVMFAFMCTRKFLLHKHFHVRLYQLYFSNEV